MNTLSGKIVLFTSPSGAGKTTLVRHIFNTFQDIDFTISTTTRAKRSHEVHGQDYYFLSVEEFKSKIENNEFLQWGEVYESQYYGTLRSEIDRIWSLGKAIIFDIDLHGAAELKQLFGEKCLAIFVKPPFVDVFIDKLASNNPKAEEGFKNRQEKIRKDSIYENTFDAVILYNELSVAQNEAEIIVNHFLQN